MADFLKNILQLHHHLNHYSNNGYIIYLKRHRHARYGFIVVITILFMAIISICIKLNNSPEPIILFGPTPETLGYHPEMCLVYPNELIKKIKSNENVTWSQIESELSHIQLEHGGKFIPSIVNENDDDESIKYRSKNKVAIIVPYKNRLRNLKIFLRYMHQFLHKQNIEYGIYLVEQADGLEFNRAYLINIGFMEALKDDPKWTCFFFHDVDLLPETDANFYRCQDAPTQFAISVNIYNYSKIDYLVNRYMGGVTAYTKEQFLKINGYSNLFFGWGGEDDGNINLYISKHFLFCKSKKENNYSLDAYERCVKMFKQVKRLSPHIGRYYANCHEKEKPNDERGKLLKNSVDRMWQDGLNSMIYHVNKITKTKLFTNILIYY